MVLKLSPASMAQWGLKVYRKMALVLTLVPPLTIYVTFKKFLQLSLLIFKLGTTMQIRDDCIK